jgi:uncharacterized membrane protein YheB (UPF0754 family)
VIALNEFWTRLGLDVVLGSVSGGVTSWVAVALIFKPYERTFGLHGAVPKNKARLAKTIGRTVGERLLTPDDIVAELHRSGLREAIESRLAEAAVSALDAERGSLREILPPAMLVEVERALRALGPTLSESYIREVHRPEFEVRVRTFVARMREELAQLPMASVLTPARRADLASHAADLAEDLIEESRKEGDRSVKAKVGDLLLRLAGTERTKSFVERTVADALARTENRNVGEMLAVVDDEAIVSWLLEAARSPRAAELALGAAGSAAAAVLDKPIGRLTRWLPADAAQRLAAAAAPAAWEQVVARLPEFLAKVDIPTMVERKVLGFSTRRVEEIVRGVTQRELNLIVELGYVLGALIGAAQFGVEWWLRS